VNTQIRANFVLLASTLLICCVLYPAALLLVGFVISAKASGSLVVEKGKAVRGSMLVAQPFTNDEYFWPRPSAATYNAAAAGGSNWGANNPKLRDRVCQQLGPIIAYKASSKSAAGGRTPQLDIEAWFAAAPDRVASWASDVSVGPANWAKTDFANDKYGLQGDYINQWAKAHPDVVAEWKKANQDKTDEPKPEDLAPQFFASFAKSYPGKFPVVVETKQPDGKTTKKIEPAAADATIQANFFDLWLSDPANKDKAADLQPVPVDMVTASGSGLDPHITLRNALSVYQLDRVAKKRAGSGDAEKLKKEIADVARSKSFTPLFGMTGEPLVNVLEINLELDQRFPVPPSS